MRFGPRFVGEARDVVTGAAELAALRGDAEVGVEHILLALVRVDDPRFAPALAQAGSDTAPVREAVERDADDAAVLAAIGIDLAALEAAVAGPHRDARQARRRPAFSGSARRALEYAVQAAKELDSGPISPTEILVGVIDEGGRGLRLLSAAGADPGVLRAALMEERRGA